MNEHHEDQWKNLSKWLTDNWGGPETSRISETAAERNMSDRDLKKASKKFAQENFQGKKFLNEDTGREILVSRDGLDKWDNKTTSRDQSLSIKKLNEILNRSKKISDEPDRKGRKFVDGFTYYEHPINVNKKPYTAKTATKDTQGNSKYYYHFLEDKK